MEPQINKEVEQKPVEKKSSMNTPTAIIVGAVIISIAIFAVFGQKGTIQKNNNVVAPKTVSLTDALKIESTDHVRGDLSKAEVVIVEYSDSDCSFCQKFHPTLIQLMDEYQGKLVWVYRHFPLSIHPNAYNEALALECVAQLGGNDAFNKYLDEAMGKTFQKGESINVELVSMATKLGVNEKAFRDCVANPKTAKIVDTHAEQAQGVGAQGTPFSVVVNLKTKKTDTIPGAYPIEEVRKILDALAIK